MSFSRASVIAPVLVAMAAAPAFAGWQRQPDGVMVNAAATRVRLSVLSETAGRVREPAR